MPNIFSKPVVKYDDDGIEKVAEQPLAKIYEEYKESFAKLANQIGSLCFSFTEKCETMKSAIIHMPIIPKCDIRCDDLQLKSLFEEGLSTIFDEYLITEYDKRVKAVNNILLTKPFSDIPKLQNVEMLSEMLAKIEGTPTDSKYRAQKSSWQPKKRSGVLEVPVVNCFSKVRARHEKKYLDVKTTVTLLCLAISDKMKTLSEVASAPPPTAALLMQNYDNTHLAQLFRRQSSLIYVNFLEKLYSKRLAIVSKCFGSSPFSDLTTLKPSSSMEEINQFLDKLTTDYEANYQEATQLTVNLRPLSAFSGVLREN